MVKIVKSEKKIHYVEDYPGLQEMTLSKSSDFDFIVTYYQMIDGNGLELMEFCQRGRLSISGIVFHSESIGPKAYQLTSKACVAVILKL